MTDAGRAVLPDLSSASFSIDSDVLSALQSEETVWRNFLNFPPLYRRVRIDTIQANKHKRPQMYEHRLKKLIDNTRLSVMYGEWNDNGRLL